MYEKMIFDWKLIQLMIEIFWCIRKDLKYFSLSGTGWKKNSHNYKSKMFPFFYLWFIEKTSFKPKSGKSKCATSWKIKSIFYSFNHSAHKREKKKKAEATKARKLIYDERNGKKIIVEFKKKEKNYDDSGFCGTNEWIQLFNFILLQIKRNYNRQLRSFFNLASVIFICWNLHSHKNEIFFIKSKVWFFIQQG